MERHKEIVGSLMQAATAEMRAYQPSLRDRIAWMLAGTAGKFGAGRYAQQDIARKAQGLMDFLPGVGEVLGADDIASSLEAGNWRNAAVNLGATMLGAMPVIGDAAGKGLQKLARGTFDLDYFGQPIRVLQNPSPLQTQGFLNRTKYKAARRIHDPETGETYLWDASDPALHQLVAEQLGIPVTDKTIMDMIGLD